MGLGLKVINTWSIAQLKQINMTITFYSHLVLFHTYTWCRKWWVAPLLFLHAPPFWGASQGLKKVRIGTLYVCGAHANNGAYPHIKVSEPHRTTHNVGPTFLSVNPTVDFFPCGPMHKNEVMTMLVFLVRVPLYTLTFVSGPQRKN